MFQAMLPPLRRLLLIHAPPPPSLSICQFLQHVMSLPMRFFTLRRVGDVLSR